MTTIRTVLILILLGMLSMSACRDKPTCLDCEGAAAEGNDDTPLPDLPCGGADLMTDNLNCGTCGYECVLYYEETEYVAGTCKDGVCGPGWSDCEPADAIDPEENLSEICVAIGETCVPNGCAGFTGLMYAVNFDGWGCGADSYEPVATMSGGCDEPIPWMPLTDSWVHLEVECCCDFEQPG